MEHRLYELLFYQLRTKGSISGGNYILQVINKLRFRHGIAYNHYWSASYYEGMITIRNSDNKYNILIGKSTMKLHSIELDLYRTLEVKEILSQ